MARRTTSEQLLNHVGTTFGITDSELADALGLRPRTIERWRSAESLPRLSAWRRLEAFDALATRLETLFTSLDGIHRWMRAPSGYVGESPLLDLLMRGRDDLVNEALEAMESGVFS